MLINFGVWATMAAERFVVQLASDTSLVELSQDCSFSIGVGKNFIEMITVGDQFKALAGEFSVEDLEYLYHDERVVAISRDRDLKLQEYKVQYGSPRHLSQLSSGGSFTFDPVSGNLVDVYVFDTGIDFKHPGLQNVNPHKLADFTSSPVPRGADPHGHGTMMAGLIASETFGVLKSCSLVDVRVADKDGEVKLSTLMKGISASVAHARFTKRPSVFVLPMTIGKKNHILDNFLQAIPKDIAIVLPAGNQQTDACDLSPPNDHNILVIGSLDRDNRLADFSNYGNCVDVYTSGTDILTLRSTDSGNEVLLQSSNGTSASCAIGAGIVGYHMSMGLTSMQAIQTIRSSSKDIYSHKHRLKLLQLKL